MERTSQWVSSQDVPADLVVRVDGAAFPLHKAVMVPGCGYIRKAVAAAAAARARGSAVVEVELEGFPGGAEAFEKAARYCYGTNFEISARNAASLLCAAAFLDMASEGGLVSRVEEFLAKVGLRTLPGAIAVLRSCEGETLAADLARRAADVVALRICNEALFATRSPADWWAAELAVLLPASFNKVVAALRSRRAGPEILAAAAIGYVELRLAEPVAEEDHRTLLESVVTVLPPHDDAPLPAAFLSRLLRAALAVDAEESTIRRDLELRLAAVLDQATAADLLSFALDDDNHDSTQPPHAAHLDTLRRVITAFVSLTSGAGGPDNKRSSNRRSSLSGSPPAAPNTIAKMQKVAKTIDEVAAEIATEETLPISKFVSIAGAIPRESRPGGAAHDCVYRAVDVYLKAHPGLDEIEREKVCSVMDPLKLSPAARLHASQNKRLPLQAVLSALYYDQLKLRSGQLTGDEDDRSEAGSARMQAKADAALARENEALRSELGRMRAHMSSSSSGSGRGQRSKGSGSRTPAAMKGKMKVGFFGSMSRTLSRLNPFRAGGGRWSKDTSNIADAAIVKPKRRRFSIG